MKPRDSPVFKFGQLPDGLNSGCELTSSPTSKVPPPVDVQSAWLSRWCFKVAVQISFAQAEVAKAIKEGLCDLIGQYAGDCDAAVDAYLPELLDMLAESVVCRPVVRLTVSDANFLQTQQNKRHVRALREVS